MLSDIVKMQGVPKISNYKIIVKIQLMECKKLDIG